eukprot:UN00823
MDKQESNERIDKFILDWETYAAEHKIAGRKKVTVSKASKRQRSTIADLKVGERPGQLTQWKELFNRELINLKRNPAGLENQSWTTFSFCSAGWSCILEPIRIISDSSE